MLRLSELTKGEKLFIFRRRENSTQAQTAKALGIPLSAYKKIEDDGETGYVLRAPGLKKLEDFEACVIMRRRKGMTLDELAEATGLTKWWLCQIERGKATVDSLRDFWNTGKTAATA